MITSKFRFCVRVRRQNTSPNSHMQYLATFKTPLPSSGYCWATSILATSSSPKSKFRINTELLAYSGLSSGSNSCLFSSVRPFHFSQSNSVNSIKSEQSEAWTCMQDGRWDRGMSGHVGLYGEWHHRLVGNIGRLGLKDFRRGAETGWRWRTLHDLAPGPNPDSARTRKTPRTGPGKNLALNPQSSPNPNRLGRGPRTGPNFWCFGAFGRSSEFEAGVENLAHPAGAMLVLVLGTPPKKKTRVGGGGAKLQMFWVWESHIRIPPLPTREHDPVLFFSCSAPRRY